MSSIASLVNELPECYQPIFGHSELGANSSRNCNDRLNKIEGIFISLKEKLGRPLRLLDLGCAQGFFSFNLAKHCSAVTGIDFLDKNISLCKALAKEQNFENIEFKEDNIQNVINNLEHDEYDIVIGFSVFHHICDADGYLTTKDKINKLANYTQILLLELAVKEEGLYWGRNLPDNPLDIVDDIGYYDILGQYPTHLSDVSRPLLFTSSKYWYVDNKIEKITHWTKYSHEFAGEVHQNSRRYYFSENNFLKRYAFDGGLSQFNKEEFENEISSLEKLNKLELSHLEVPDLIHSEKNDLRGLVLTTKLPGERLSNLLQRLPINNEVDAVNQIVVTLAELESHNLYHNDVRIWNVLYSEEKFKLIDFGAISERNSDVLWPYNPFLGFIIFINELNMSNNYQLVPARTPMFSPFWAKTPKLAQFLAKLWATPHQNWSYKFFLNELNGVTDDKSAQFNVNISPNNLALWMFATETLINESRTRESSLVLHNQNEMMSKLDSLLSNTKIEMNNDEV
ncbi:methyltransferase domain-containing protein [Erwinia sp. S63]|uniref:methyltransferase domain-containing protein n=1 Tax=Erwinia sp. S63 TaxID=2769341 RepID=UPI00190C9700|nr:methyltransferase domain-containing protein [Erwinia sp. S63]MBK0094565.1 methyltransferase domain-containing protein [Erwinia sp. S63]